MPARRSHPDFASRLGGTILTGALVALAAWTPTAVAAPAPTRKPHRTPPPIQRDDITGTIAVKGPPRDHAPPPVKADDERLPEPFHLPVASRATMHECGMTWQSLKMAGDTGDETWREFASHCLSTATAHDETPKR